MLSETNLASTELLKQAQAGDSDSLGKLLATYNNYMRVLSYGRLDERIQHRISTSDIVQESLLEAHRDFSKFTGSSLAEFTGWLRKILIHNLASAVEVHLLAEKRDVRKERAIEELTHSFSQSHGRFEALLRDQRPSPLSEVDQQETLVNLANAIASLSEEYRDVIVLRHIEGLPFADIGTRLGRTSGAVRMIWMRAIERLRENMSAS